MGGKKINSTTAGIIIAIVVVIVAALTYKYVFTLNQTQTPSGKAFEDKMRAAHSGTAGHAYPAAGTTGAPTQ